MMHINKKIIILGILLIVVIISVPMIFTKISHTGKYSVDLVVAPKTAAVLVNNIKASHGVNYFEPGLYAVSASHAEFAPLDLELVVNKGENQPFTIMLTPTTDKGWEIARNDPSFLELEKVAGELAAQQGDTFRETNPIVNHLPYRSGLFNIDYRLQENSEFEIVLIITVHELEKEYPHDQMREWGFNPSDFEIEYRSWQ